MNFEKFTIKAQQTVQEAVNGAQRSGQQTIEPVHILRAILTKAQDVAGFLFQKQGVNPQHISQVVESEVNHLPKVSGGNGQPYLSNERNFCYKNFDTSTFVYYFTDDFFSEIRILATKKNGPMNNFFDFVSDNELSSKINKKISDNLEGRTYDYELFNGVQKTYAQDIEVFQVIMN